MATQTQSTLLDAQRRMSRYREQRMAVMAEAQRQHTVPKSAAVNPQYAPPRQDSMVNRGQIRSKPARIKVSTQVPPHPSTLNQARQFSHDAPTRTFSKGHQMNSHIMAHHAPIPANYPPMPASPVDEMQRHPSRYRRQPVVVTTQVPPRPQYMQGPRLPSDEAMVRYQSRSQRVPPDMLPMQPMMPAQPMMEHSPNIYPEVEDVLRKSKSRYRRNTNPEPEEPVPITPVEPQPTGDETVETSQPDNERTVNPELDDPQVSNVIVPEHVYEEPVQRSKSRYRRVPNQEYDEPQLSSATVPEHVYDEPVQRSKSRYRRAPPLMAHEQPAGLMRVLSDPQLSKARQRAVISHGESRLMLDDENAQMALQQQKTVHNDSRMVSNDRVLRKELSLDSMQRAPSHSATRPPPMRPQTSAEAQAMFMQQQQNQMAYAQQRQAQNARAEARQLLENEAERQRRLTIKLKAQKEKQKAEEQRLREKQEAEEQQQREKQVAEEEQQKAETEKRLAEEERVKTEHGERQRAKEVEEERAARARQQLEDQRAAEAKRQRNEERAAELAQRKKAKEAEAERQRIEKEQAASEQKEKSREIAQPDTATVNSSNATSSLTSAATSNKDRFAFLKRRKGDEAPKSANILGRAKSTRGNGPPQTIRPGGGGVVPGTDAPVSAVNAGERRVFVECEGASIALPITPSTTPRDLITSAANCLAVEIVPKTSVLLESFGKIGVQRPLRSYEHIRDVMNSWDDDQQNVLVIVPSATGGQDDDLEVDSVPTEQPSGMSCFLFYSQNPGKWEKRWITLRNDGQVVHSKKEDGANSTNVCHLSDFDIYSPTPKEIAKKIKPPKKLCFAIKSQQKSSYFLATASFVHFFATGDKKTAAAWYKAIQRWRSWYLVNVMGEGQHGFGGSGKRNSHYQLGSFKPLIDMDDFGLGLNSTDKPEAPSTELSHTRSVSARNRQGPPSSYPKNFANGAFTHHEHGPSLASNLSNGASVEEDDTFAPKGLLGRSYSQRQKAQREHDLAAKNASPFTLGSSLLSDINTAAAVKMSLDLQGPWTGSHKYSSSTAQQSQSRSDPTKEGVRLSMDLKRNASTHKPSAQPLVDLTPRYQEPPQHTRKGKGFTPEQVGPGGLIDSATSPENAITIPPAADWRARPSADLSRSRSVRRAADSRDDGSAELAEALARFESMPDAGQGTATGGRGVADGAHAARTGKPMLSMASGSTGASGGSKFAVGSLLERVWKEKLGRDGTGAKVAEKKEAEGGLAIDRSKGKEIRVGVGEGM